MKPIDELEFGKCPTCGAGALIGTRWTDSGLHGKPGVRIEYIECTSADCLHYRSFLPAS